MSSHPISLSVVQERFWAKVDRDGPTVHPELGPCWLWTNSVDGNGYGRFWHPTKAGYVSAHRFAYALLVGAVATGLELDHTCRVRSCVRPSHLEPVTQSENKRRQGAARTHCAQGHDYTAANTYHRPGGHRQCRQCIRDRVRNYRLRRRNVA